MGFGDGILNPASETMGMQNLELFPVILL